MEGNAGMKSTRRGVWSAIGLGLIVTGCGVAQAGGKNDSQASEAVVTVDAQEAAPATTSPVSMDVPTTSAAPKTTHAPTTTAAVARVETPAPVVTYHVTHVVDGDTIDVVGQDGVSATVRIICIDAPERNRCGFDAATEAMLGFVADKDVALTAAARDDIDKYGRLLRYVDVEGTDAGRAMIDAGLAIARYDSRDGYGKHPRQDEYLVADYVSPSYPECSAPPTSVAAKPAAVPVPVPVPVVVQPVPTPAPTPALAPSAAPSNSGCEPAYPTVCIPRGPDLDCGDISFRRFVVNPPDPFRFDADGDGVGCESG